MDQATSTEFLRMLEDVQAIWIEKACDHIAMTWTTEQTGGNPPAPADLRKVARRMRRETIDEAKRQERARSSEEAAAAAMTVREAKELIERIDAAPAFAHLVGLLIGRRPQTHQITDVVSQISRRACVILIKRTEEHQLFLQAPDRMPELDERIPAR